MPALASAPDPASASSTGPFHISSTAKYNSSADVLNEYHRRNRPTKPPAAQLLYAAAQKQLRRHNLDKENPPQNIEGEGNLPANSHDDHQNEPEDGHDDPQDEPEDNQPQRRAPRHSKSDGTAGPTTLQYYWGGWKEALIEAKKRLRLHIVLESPFPTRENIHEAGHLLTEVVEEFKAEKVVFDNGMKTLIDSAVQPVFTILWFRIFSRPVYEHSCGLIFFLIFS